MEFTVSTKIKASAEQIYTAWLDSREHSKMIDDEATASDTVGGSFTAWDDYIEGTNLELVPHSKIVQLWRTSQFAETDEDSIIEITLVETNGVTEITLIHTNLAEDGEHYIKGWEDHYFEPMKEYFEK